jgi:outer membrane protein OmpA-like peptidoglycan-associated protein
LIEIIIVEEFITEKGVMLIKTNPIYFDLNKSDIREDAAIELNKVVKIMEDNPTIKIELNSHTDSRAPDGYNMRLSNDRAKSSINYIISQGINPARLSGKGYGETRLVNKCSNGVKCTNSQHEENRRTEFIVINE